MMEYYFKGILIVCTVVCLYLLEIWVLGRGIDCKRPLGPRLGGYAVVVGMAALLPPMYFIGMAAIVIATSVYAIYRILFVWTDEEEYPRALGWSEKDIAELKKKNAWDREQRKQCIKHCTS